MPTFLDATADAQPAPAAAAPSSGGGGGKTFLDALGDVGHAAAGAGDAVLEAPGKALGFVLDKLDRPRQAVQAGIAGKNPLSALWSGVSPEDQDANREVVRQKIGAMLGDSAFADRYHSDPHWAQGVEDFLVDTVTDPTIVGAKFTEMARAAGLTGKAAEIARPLSDPIARAARAVPKKIGDLDNGLVGDVAKKVQDAFTYGGSAKRDLGTPTYDRAIAAENRQAALEEQAKNVLTDRFNAAIGALPDDDRLEVYRALNGERDTRGMTDAQAAAVAEGRRLTTQAGGLYATEAGRRKLAYGGGKLLSPAQVGKVTRNGEVIGGEAAPAGAAAARTPDDELSALAQELFGPGSGAELLGKVKKTPGVNLAAPVGSGPAPRRLVGRVDRSLDLGDLSQFAAPTEQGLLDAGNVRSRYLPGPAGDKSLVDPNAPARQFNLLDPKALNLPERESFEVDRDALPNLDQAFRGMLANAARQGTAGRLRDELGVTLGGANNPDLVKLFEQTAKAKGDARGLGQKVGERVAQVVNIPKNTVSTIGLKHGLINVPALALASEGPGAMLEGLAGGVKALARKPADDFAAHQAGILGGVITPFTDRSNPIADALARAPGPVGSVLGGASENANRLTWAIDDAAKQAVFLRKYQRLRKEGLGHAEASDRAAANTLREMVDYRHNSDVTKALKYVAPFATFRTKIPAAIASSLARNPQRILTGNRATGGLLGSGKVQIGTNDDGTPKMLTLTTPISDVLGLGDPGGAARYARSMIADPLKALLSAPGDVGEAQGALSPRQAELLRYFTYGQHVLPHMKDDKLKAGFLGQTLAGYVPMGLGEDALSVAGGSDFPTPDPLSMLLGGTIGGYVR